MTRYNDCEDYHGVHDTDEHVMYLLRLDPQRGWLVRVMVDTGEFEFNGLRIDEMSF